MDWDWGWDDDMNELKPCPFCGSEEICFNDLVTPDYVTCIDCGADGPLADRDGKKWNAAPPLPSRVQTALVFAARYTHHRETGGTLMVTEALTHVWDQLSEDTQTQILKEAYEATANQQDWIDFRAKMKERR